VQFCLQHCWCGVHHAVLVDTARCTLYRLIRLGAGTWLHYGPCMQLTTEVELLGSEADYRVWVVWVVWYTPPLYTIHTSCRSSFCETCTCDMYGLQTAVCIALWGLSGQPRSLTVSTRCVACMGHDQSGARLLCLIKWVIQCSFSDISDNEVVSVSQLLLDECVSAKWLCVCECVCVEWCWKWPPEIRAPLTDRQKLVNERDSRLAQYFCTILWFGAMLGLFSYFQCKIWRYILALWPWSPIKMTKFCVEIPILGYFIMQQLRRRYHFIIRNVTEVKLLITHFSFLLGDVSSL